MRLWRKQIFGALWEMFNLFSIFRYNRPQYFPCKTIYKCIFTDRVDLLKSWILNIEKNKMFRILDTKTENG